MAEKKEPLGPKSKKAPVDFSLIPDDEKEALRKEARESLLSEMKQDARDKYFQDEFSKLKRDKTPDEREVRVTIDVPPFVPFIMLDHVQFFHGYTYPVRMSVAAVLLEQMQRAWAHQNEIDGRRRAEAYRVPQSLRIGMSHAGTATRGVNGVVNAEI